MSFRQQISQNRRFFVYAVVVTFAGALIEAVWLGVFDYNLFGYDQVTRESIPNSLNPDEGLYFFTKLRSPTFAANSEIPTQVFLYLNDTYRNHNMTENASQEYHITFTGTYCGEVRQNEIPRLCKIVAYRQSDDFYWGIGNLTYSHGGTFDVSMDAIGHSTTTHVGKGFVNISPTESGNDFRTFKMSFIIGVIAATFSFLSLYEQRRMRQP